MGSFSIWHWLIVLLIVVMVFGTKKLKNMGSDLGGGRQGLQGRHEGWLLARHQRHDASHRPGGQPGRR